MVMLGYKNYADIRDIEMAEKLIVERGVGLLLLSGFYHDRQCNRYLAMNITLPSDEFREALGRLAGLKENLKVYTMRMAFKNSEDKLLRYFLIHHT